MEDLRSYEDLMREYLQRAEAESLAEQEAAKEAAWRDSAAYMWSLPCVTESYGVEL